MTWTVASLLLLAIVFANLPFLSERVFLIWLPGSGHKSAWLRIAELVVLYFLTGAVAYLMEARLGPVHSQHWEFWPITTCLFLVFAYPGFLYRYLWRR